MEGFTAMDNAAERYDLITVLSRLESLEAQCVWRPRMDRLRRFVEALRVLGRTNDPNRVFLIENAINEYLKAEPETLRLSLERLCDAIEREEAEKRRGEDWSIAKDYVRSRLRRLA
jgi:hypothetical protein